MHKCRHIYIYIYILYLYIYLKTLNECIKSTTCAKPVSLNCFSGAD